MNHGTWPHGTDWLYEAATGTYLPLLRVLDELLDEGYHPKVTIGITPVLAEQLSHPHFQQGLILHLNQRILSARTDERYFFRIKETTRQTTARFWFEHYSSLKESFLNIYEKNILKQFQRLEENGALELLTCGATHGYFPLLGYDENIRAQVETALATHEKHFGKKPRGIWLPECGYRPHYLWKNPVEESEIEFERAGIEEILSDAGVEFFFTDSQLLQSGETTGAILSEKKIMQNEWNYTAIEIEEEIGVLPEGRKNPCEVYYVQSQLGSGKKVAVFSREPKTATQVWSGILGYPGDPYYLEFHKKNFPGGHRYWRVTDSKVDLGKKQLYDVEKIEDRIENQATHFVGLIQSVLEKNFTTTGKEGILCAPYDAELFGHWWFEGPRFLKKVLQKLERETTLQLTTASEELDKRKPRDVIALPEGSWGEGNNHQVWLSDKTAWTWKLVYECERKFREILSLYFSPMEEHSESEGELLRNILEQAARELLILEASDWQFLISQKSAKDYAERRILEHTSSFQQLIAFAGKILRHLPLETQELSFLETCKLKDGLFEQIDLRWWMKM